MKVKLNVFLSAPWRLHLFLTTALNWCEWLSSRPDRFTPDLDSNDICILYHHLAPFYDEPLLQNVTEVLLQLRIKLALHYTDSNENVSQALRTLSVDPSLLNNRFHQNLSGGLADKIWESPEAGSLHYASIIRTLCSSVSLEQKQSASEGFPLLSNHLMQLKFIRLLCVTKWQNV